MTAGTGGKRTHVVRGHAVPLVALSEVGTQQVLLGRPRGDASPMLMGITVVKPQQTSVLIEHDTAEVCYVLEGSGAIVTDTTEQQFESGDAILIEAGGWHAIRADEKTVRMLYVFPTPDTPPTRICGT